MATIREVSAVSLFIFSILITLQVSGAEDDDQDSEDYKIDIREFLNTSETIWTLNTTSKTPQMCKKETTYNITTNETFFRRTYQGSSEEFLQGTFLYNTFSSEYDAMDVGKPGKLVDKEEIVFQGYNNTCAVFKITLRANEIIYFSYNQREIVYELRVKSSSIKKPDKECLEEYLYSMPYPKKSTLVYYPYCK
uniref:Lipocalin n=1 Tax=Rhipicephalus appendiculatus TaxID=34631 RepID=A0A131Z8F6_RHIAP